MLGQGVGGHDHGQSATAWLPAALAVLLGLAYVVAVWRRDGAARGWSRWRTASFAAGALLVAAAVSPPAEVLGHRTATGHMAQHLAIGMIAPLLLVLGAPMTLLLGALSPSRRRPFARPLRSRALHVVTHPITALVLSTGALYLLYLTTAFEVVRGERVLHHLLHLHFLLAGYLFAWVVAGPDPAPRRPGTVARAVLLFSAAAAHGYLAKLLYAQAAELPLSTVHELADVQDAARLMFYGGDAAEILLAVALFAGWYRVAGVSSRRPARTS